MLGLTILYSWFGIGDNGKPNDAYSFWSGIGGQLFTMLAFLGVFYRYSLACSWPKCYRPGRPFGNHRLCNKHHPDGPLTKDQILGVLEKVDELPVVDPTEERDDGSRRAG